jgi:hypothetical protein
MLLRPCLPWLERNIILYYYSVIFLYIVETCLLSTGDSLKWRQIYAFSEVCILSVQAFAFKRGTRVGMNESVTHSRLNWKGRLTIRRIQFIDNARTLPSQPGPGPRVTVASGGEEKQR